MRNEKNPVQTEFLALLDGYCAGTLDETASGRFVSLLESDQSYKRTFVEYVDLHADLYDQVGLVDHEFDIPHLLHVINDASDDLKRHSRRHITLAAFASGLLCTLCLLAAGWYWFDYTYRFGKVLAIAGGDLMFREEPRLVTQRLGFGRLAVDQGAASIQLNDQVSFVMEASTEVDILSRNSFRLLRGQVSVETGGGKVDVLIGKQRLKNLGTSFTVSHDNDTSSAVHVVDGAIMIEGAKPTAKSQLVSRIDAGEAVSVEDQDPPQSIPFNRSVFVNPLQLANDINEKVRTKPTCQIAEHQRNRMPGLVLRHSFEEVDENSEYVLNQAVGQSGFGRGKIYGAKPVEGRLPGSTALRFRGKEFDDRVELVRSDSMHFDAASRMTLMMWFRTPGLDEPNARIISRGMDVDLAWNVWWRANDHVFGVGYAHEGKTPHVVERWGFDDGNWHHFAATWVPTAARRSTIAIYFDGQFIKQHTDVSVLSSYAPLLIGNCLAPDGTYLSFLGDIDEVALFNRCLSAEEIAAEFARD